MFTYIQKLAFLLLLVNCVSYAIICILQAVGGVSLALPVPNLGF